MPRLSVIVPVYNAAPFLRDCVESLLSQRFADFEVILVDDGSTDGSGAICDELAGKDPRVVVVHKENGGACSARNCGIDHAQGEFIVFVDGDDLVTDDHLEHLMESDADMVVTGLQKFGAKNGTEKPARRDDFGIDGLAAHWNTPPDMNYLYCYPVAKRFRTSIVREHGIRFDESLFFSEDMCFDMDYYFHAESFTEMPYADYRYRLMNVTRDEKYRMSAAQLATHHERLETCFRRLYERIGADALPFVRDNTNLRVMRKFYSFLMQDGITSKVFVQNVRSFREKSWSGYMMGLLKGKKERRVMREAVRFPLLTYWIECRLQHAIHQDADR
jgi:glycosyltransferase involved in cell wall biosynthesis